MDPHVSQIASKRGRARAKDQNLIKLTLLNIPVMSFMIWNISVALVKNENNTNSPEDINFTLVTICVFCPFINGGLFWWWNIVFSTADVGLFYRALESGVFIFCAVVKNFFLQILLIMITFVLGCNISIKIQMSLDLQDILLNSSPGCCVAYRVFKLFLITLVSQTLHITLSKDNIMIRNGVSTMCKTQSIKFIYCITGHSNTCVKWEIWLWKVPL